MEDICIKYETMGEKHKRENYVIQKKPAAGPRCLDWSPCTSSITLTWEAATQHVEMESVPS